MQRLQTYFGTLIDAFRRADSPPPTSFFAFIRWALGGTEPVVLVALAFSVAVGVTEVIGAWLIGYLVDYALSHGPGSLFASNWLLFVGTAAFFILLRPTFMGINSALNSLSVQANLYPLILGRLNRHTLGQSLSFFDDDFAGRIAQKQQQTARAIMDVVMESLNIGGLAIASFGAAFFVMGGIDPRLAAVFAIWLIFYALLIRHFLPKIRTTSKDRAAARAMVTGQVVDAITNIATVKLFAHSEFEDDATKGALSNYRKAAIRFGGLSALFRYLLMTLAGTLPVAMIGGSFWLWSAGLASPGDIATAALISTRLAHMTGFVSFTLLTIYSNVGEIEDGIRTLTPPHSIADRPDASPPAAATGEIRFDNVSFDYGKDLAAGAALYNFNLTIKPGEKVGLVGRSGAGKSTAVSLLLRLYEVEQGSVRLDGTDIRDLTQDGLRRQISMVTQDTAMFNRPARENIRYGAPGASDEAVMAAARQAEAHAFIQNLQDFRGRTGYDAHLGERGVKLSGGQRQRIAIARAILKDAPVLVLDEATSSLDSEVEAQIQQTLADVMEGKTVIAIAHRLSTIARMDRIVVLDEGRIVEEGSHETLLAQGGLYADFWAHQSGGFLGLAAE
ncbi:MAG: ABC transporter ATP-binding protein [Pseudomonadota bacterium]